ncbi:uncharacterized protein EV154DRAFT_489848, partial [Mucor mucedo]|uniref:uncharacterized protein n=1 Tax=Mucor mucedo TaxID=29922 RepID=UPI0022209285
MNLINNHTQLAAASFFTSFTKKKPLGLPSTINRSFLQSPTSSWPEKTSWSEKKQKETIQQAMYILPKSPSTASIYLQLPKFRSLSVFLRCGHVSQLVENWLCNPMEQLKRTAFQRRIMPHVGTLSVTNHETSIVPYKPLFIHFQNNQQTQMMEVKYVPCLFTVVCVTYDCGSVSLSVNQIDSLEFLASSATMDPFLVKCNLLPNHPVTIHHLDEAGIMHTSLPLICDYASDDTIDNLLNTSTISEYSSEDEEVLVDQAVTDDVSIMIEDPVLIDNHPVLLVNRDPTLDDKVVEFMHLDEPILYNQDDDDDDSCLYSSSEEYSVLEDLDTEEEEDEHARNDLLRLVQDTLEYIHSNHGAYSDELNNLEYKLYQYNRAATSAY